VSEASDMGGASDVGDVKDSTAAIARVAATIRGDVQGVGFRWFVAREARHLGLVGWVANAPDGSVRLEAQGDRAAVDRLLEHAHVGPPGARVDGVTSNEMQPRPEESGFAIRSLAHSGD
jgi:acylphosphatase